MRAGSVARAADPTIKTKDTSGALRRRDKRSSPRKETAAHPEMSGRRYEPRNAVYSAPAALRTNGYETMTMPPPWGFGNSQRRTACAIHCSTDGLFIVDCCTTEATTA